MNIIWKGSPNYWAGRTQPVSRIVIHWMAGTLSSADATFSKESSQVSAHYGIEDDTVHQYVRDEDTGWHARQANPFSVGIEHSAQPGRDASTKTLETSAQLIATLAKKYKLPINENTVVPHSLYVATQCPGSMIPLDALISRAGKISGTTVTVVDKPSLPQPKANTTTTGTVHLPASANSWRVYPLSKTPTVGNEVGTLKPSSYGGLTYDILGNPTANVYTIQTRDYGKVNIYAGSETGATVAVTSGQGITKGSGGKTVYLPSVPSWRVYREGGKYSVGNEIGYLAPAKYGGLAYAILSQPAANIAVIQTQTFGRVAIYTGSETGAVIK